MARFRRWHCRLPWFLPESWVCHPCASGHITTDLRCIIFHSCHSERIKRCQEEPILESKFQVCHQEAGKVSVAWHGNLEMCSAHQVFTVDLALSTICKGNQRYHPGSSRNKSSLFEAAISQSVGTPGKAKAALQLVALQSFLVAVAIEGRWILFFFGDWQP